DSAVAEAIRHHRCEQSSVAAVAGARVVSARKDKGRLPPFVPVDLEMMNSPAWRAGGMSVEPRHYCRNLKCRSRLPEPVENEHRAFCTRGCYKRFYRNRCRVCERDLRKAGKRGDAARMYCRPPANCLREAEKWLEKYACGPFFRRRSSEVPIPRASKPAPRATGHRIGACAVG